MYLKFEIKVAHEFPKLQHVDDVLLWQLNQGWLVSRAHCRPSRLTQLCSRAQLTTHAVCRDLNCQLIYSVATAEARMVRSSTRE